MTFPFDPRQGLIIVIARATGPLGSVRLRMALDTGALTSLIDPSLLALAGYDPTIALQRTQIVTPAGNIVAPVHTIDSLTSLGKTRILMPVVCAPLDPSASIDGLLGLDFFRGTWLTLDFIAGQLDLR
jgi:hypothetical protein